MNLYLISQTVNYGWDTYDGAVVAAIDAESAKRIYPCEVGDTQNRRFDENDQCVFIYNDGHTEPDEPYAWCQVKDVQVRLIGHAAPDIAQGVVFVSYNAG